MYLLICWPQHLPKRGRLPQKKRDQVHHSIWYVAEEDILTFASPLRKFDSSSEDDFGCQILICYLYTPGSYQASLIRWKTGDKYIDNRDRTVPRVYLYPHVTNRSSLEPNHLSPLLSKASHLSTVLSKPTPLSTFFEHQKNRISLKSTFWVGLLFWVLKKHSRSHLESWRGLCNWAGWIKSCRQQKLSAREKVENAGRVTNCMSCQLTLAHRGKKPPEMSV